MAACTHPDEYRTARYELSDYKRNVRRIVKCAKCRRIISRRRSRWKSRPDRRRALLPEKQRYRAPEPKKGAAERLLDALADCYREAYYLPQDDLRLWAGHPVARRWRRCVRSWWALPSAAVQPYIRFASKRAEYRAIFGPEAPDKHATVRHANDGGHLRTLHRALESDPHPENLPELTRKAVSAIYRACPTLRKRDIPTQFNLWT